MSPLDDLYRAVYSVETASLSAQDRRTAAYILQNAADRLKDPYYRILEIWAAPSRDAALKVLIDTGLFAKWAASSKKVQTTAELAGLCSVDPDLLASLLRHLVNFGMITEESPNAFGQTAFSLFMADPFVEATVKLHFKAFLPTFTALPAYLAATHYARPTDPSFSPLSYAKQYNGSFLDWQAAENRACGRDMDMMLRSYSHYKSSWVDRYDVQDLVHDLNGNIAVVDVGGGLGHDLEAMKTRFPELKPNQLVLQERPQVVESINLTDMTVMTHDFMQQQPIKGARAYFLQMIIHDHPDHLAREILRKIRPALVHKKSRILLSEMITPPANAGLNNTCFDMVMLGMFAAKERSEQDFIDLVESVGGLYVEGISRGEDTSGWAVLDIRSREFV